MANVWIKPSEKLEIQLSRPDSKLSWGFRLQGGIDFSTPLSIQSVNPNSVSEQCGLKAGDAILAINNMTSDAMTHDDAKEVIVSSGNHITMLVQRGAVKIWKPQVTPLNELRPQELQTIKAATGEDVIPVQKTSLTFNRPPDVPSTIGSSHNRSAQPFGKPKATTYSMVPSQPQSTPVATNYGMVPSQPQPTPVATNYGMVPSQQQPRPSVTNYKMMPSQPQPRPAATTYGTVPSQPRPVAMAPSVQVVRSPTKAAVPNVIHNKYNSPMGLYSANNIADTFAKQTVGIQSQMENMELNDAPLGTVLSGTGQILEQEVPVLGSPGTDSQTLASPPSILLQSVGMSNSSVDTTDTATVSAATTTTATSATNNVPGYRPVSPAFQPQSSLTARSSAATTNSVSGFRPVSPAFLTSSTPSTTTTSSVSGFRPVPAALQPTTATFAKTSSVPGFRPVSPAFQPSTATTATTSGGLGYRPVSPALPSPTTTTAATAPPSSPTTINNHNVADGGAGGAEDDDGDEPSGPIMQSRSFQRVQQDLEAQEETNNNANIKGFKSVSAPVARPPSERPQEPSMRCGGCDMLATGVIVKASGVPYHVACFKCDSCAMNLKQKGFFVVEGKLYCETHAKRHAKPPAPDMVAEAVYR